MAFYSLLFETPQQEQSFHAHPWMRMIRKKIRRKYEITGNKSRLASGDGVEDAGIVPEYFSDLNLDRVMESIVRNQADQDLTELFQGTVREESLISYRQQVMLDLEREEALAAFSDFHRGIETAKRLMDYGRQVHYPAQKEMYTLDAVRQYCDAIEVLRQQTASLSFHSPGLKAFAEHINSYANCPEYKKLTAAAKDAANRMEAIALRLRVCGGRVEIEFSSERGDYLDGLNSDLDCVRRLGADELEIREVAFFRQLELCPLEVRILGLVQDRYAEEFRRLHEFAQTHSEFMEDGILRFSSEVRFYLLYMSFMRRMRDKGFPFTYPALSPDGRMDIRGLYDLALADQAQDAAQVVGNDCVCSPGEAGVIITGANQGGKTTFARSLGQAAALAALGLPVPAQSAVLPLYRKIFTQFSEREDSLTRDGKLKRELERLSPLLSGADNRSLVVLNELFSSTTARDALEMGKQVISKLIDAGAAVVCVTHIAELANSCPGMVSLVAQVREADGTRTYRIRRAPADGLAHAAGLMAQYRLSYTDIKGRIGHGI